MSGEEGSIDYSVVCPLCQDRVKSTEDEEPREALRRHFRDCWIFRLMSEELKKALY